MNSFDLYGFKRDDMESLRSAIERALGIMLTPHESLYVGDYYLFKSTDGMEMRLKKNVEPLDEEVLERDFPEYALLVSVAGIEKSQSEQLETTLTNAIPELELLRRKR